MNKKIRGLDEKAYRAIKACAELEGRTVGEVVSDAIRAYLAGRWPWPNTGSLRDLVPQKFPRGCEHLSEDIDFIVYRS